MMTEPNDVPVREPNQEEPPTTKTYGPSTTVAVNGEASADKHLTANRYVKPGALSLGGQIYPKTTKPVFGNLVVPSREDQERRAKLQLANITAAERKRQRRQERNLRQAK